MLLVSGGMKFIQEARSGNAAEALKDLVSNTCTALRDDERIEIPFDELVPGDVIRLSAGDMVPADARVITARDLFVIESALTGESEAVEKTAAATAVEGADGSALPLSACKNIVFTGTSVQNGTAMALVVATGSDTYLGGIAKMLNGRSEKSAFDRGVSSVSMLLVRLMLVMAPAVFAINAATKGNVIDALLFATSVSVGITPQMLPVIVTTSLSQGAKDLARPPVFRVSGQGRELYRLQMQQQCHDPSRHGCHQNDEDGVGQTFQPGAHIQLGKVDAAGNERKARNDEEHGADIPPPRAAPIR